MLSSILQDVRLPRMARIRQRFADNGIPDVGAAVRHEMERPEIAGRVRSGMTVAVTAGSRGIAAIGVILRQVVAVLKERGARPFIFPAMGSHGGSTSEGQALLLRGYGITEALIGAPVKSTMETRIIGTTERGLPVHLDRFAAEADGILVVGRIKPHTAFHATYESGLVKMMAIGMGKQKGAETCHAAGFGMFSEILPSLARVTLSKANIMFGIGIVENALKAPCRIEAILPGAILEREPELLEEARRLMPSLPFQDFDVLVVDAIGKNYSGDGADPNVTGTYCTPYASGGPRIKRYVILDVGGDSMGNSLGVGMADITTARLFGKTDFDEMYPNALTSRALNTVRMPMVMKNDRLALQAALYTCIDADLEHPKIVRIPNTSEVQVIGISEALLDEAAKNPSIEVVDPPRELAFDAEGNLLSA